MSAINPSVLQGDTFVAGNFACRTFSPPEGCIDNNAIVGAAGISYSKLVHKLPIRYSQDLGAAVAAKTTLVHIAHAPGAVVAVELITTTPPTTTDTVEVDVKKGNAATAYATILTAPIELDSASVARTVYSGAVADADYEDGDSFQIAVTVAGTSCQGLIVVLWLAENPA